MAVQRARVQTEAFDVNHEIADLQGNDGRVGAICSFIGTVRDLQATGSAAPALTGLELEHYPVMTEQALESMIEQACARFAILDVRIIHRVGVLRPLEPIVLVLVSASHRAESFQACAFLMDYLKTQAPFWKKEHTAMGAYWVDARESDDLALARWGDFPPNQAR